MNKYNVITKKFVAIFFMSVFIFILNFPKVGKEICVGLDPSYAFAFNYFFQNNIQIGKDIVFTFGPLGFILFPHPIGHNIEIALIVISVIKFMFIYLYFYLGSLIEKKNIGSNRVILFLIVLLSSMASDLGITLIILNILLLLIFKETKNSVFVFFSAIITVLALLIKSSYGIMACLVIFSFSILLFKFMWKKILLLNTSIVLGFLLAWFFIYHNFYGIINYFYGILELSSGNSSAMVINVPYNWIALLGFVFCFFLVIIYLRERKICFLYGILLLPMLAFWKYSFSRIDHAWNFIMLVFGFYLLIILYIEKVKPMIPIMSLLLSISLLYVCETSINDNTRVGGYISSDFLFTKIVERDYNNFYTDCINYKGNIAKLKKQSTNNLKLATLSDKAREIIGDSTVDIYPWEMSYIPSNNLNWKPRPVFQSYLTYTPWLDRLNSVFISSDKAPKYIIWDRKDMNSIDNRYLLNDEPSTLFNILNKYSVDYSDENVILFKRNFKNNFSDFQTLSETESRLDTWIEVPKVDKNTILRAKVMVDRKLLGKLKRLIYKDCYYYINYKASDGSYMNYRLVIDNASSGLWINPLITGLNEKENTFCSEKINYINIVSDSDFYLNKNIKIIWEYSKILEDSNFYIKD